MDMHGGSGAARLVIGFLVAFALGASAAEWRSLGPGGGDSRLVAVDPRDPSTLYATTTEGRRDAPRHLFRSRDDGQTWARLPIPDELSVRAVAVDPGDSDVLLVGIGPDPSYARSLRAGVFRSEDGGATFERVGGFPHDPDAGELPVAEIVWSPADRNVVWAVGSWGDALIRSEDAGLTWQRLDSPLDGRDRYAFALSNPRIVYARSGRGLERTVDGGATWEVRNLPPEVVLIISALAVSPRNPEVVFVSSYGWSRALATEDGGATWHRADGGLDPSQPVNAFAFDPTTPGRVFASLDSGLVVTEDEGTTWRPMPGAACRSDAGGFLFGPDGALYVDFKSEPNVLFPGISFARGFARSRDGGRTFERSFRGPAAALVSSLAVGSSPGTLLAGMPGPPGRSEDRGATWARPTNASGDCPRDLTALAADPTGTLHAVAFASSFSSVDDGRTWRSTAPFVPFVNPTAIRPDPRPDGPLFVVARGTPFVGAIAEGVASHETSGLFRSTDAGGTFARIADIRDDYDAPLRDVAFDPGNPDVVWAAGAHGLLRSTDRGRRFSAAWDQLRLTAIAFDLTRGTRLVVASEGFGIFVALDGATSFALSAGLPSVRQDDGFSLFPAFTALVSDPSSPGTLYAAARTLPVSFDLLPTGIRTTVPVPGGVFVSRDGGRTWGPLSKGLPSPDVTSLALETRGEHRLYAGTWQGVFTLDLSAPFLDSVFPADGPAEGGTLVLVKGRGFTPKTRVLFDGVAGTEETFFDERTLRVRTPPHAPGFVTVSVVDPDLGADDLSSAFRYADWAAGCVEDSATLCLERGRFSVRVETPEGGRGQAFPMTAKTGGFWLSIYEGLDVVVKVLDGRTIDGRYWIHHSGLTERAYTVVVTDTVTGKSRLYPHPAGPTASEIDKGAFP